MNGATSSGDARTPEAHELAHLISHVIGDNCHPDFYDYDLAEQILAAGWRKEAGA